MSRDLLFEVGVEELPTGYILPALDQLERGVTAGLGELRLGHGAVRVRASFSSAGASPASSSTASHFARSASSLRSG